jgi:hypothetical protein
MKTKLLGKLHYIRFFTNITGKRSRCKKKKQKNSRPKRKPSLIVFNEKSSYKESDSQKSIQRAIRSKDNSSFTKTKSEKDKLGFTRKVSIIPSRAKSGVFYLHAAF